MASRGLNPARDDAPDLAHIHLRAALDGANSPTMDVGCGRFIKSVVRNSTGLLTITLQEGFVAVKTTTPSIEANGSPVNLFPQVKAIDLVSGKTITVNLFKLVSAGSGSDATTALADPPAKGTEACFLNLVIVARNTVVA